VDASDEFEEFFQVFPRGFLAGEGAEENGQVRGEFLVLQNVVGDAPGIHGGIIEEPVPVVRAALEAEVFRPIAQGGVVLGRRRNLALNLAPVAGVVAVFQAEFAQTEALLRP